MTTENKNTENTTPRDDQLFCTDCGRAIDAASAVIIGGEIFCSECAPNWTICTTCGALVSRDDATETASGVYCPDCCVECYDCGEIIPRAEAEIIGGEAFCNYCADDWTVCDGCGELIKNCDAYTGPDGLNYCESCFYDSFGICDCCGEPVEQDDMVRVYGQRYGYHNREELYYCPRCAERNATECESCGDYYASTDDLTWTRDGYICGSCLDDYYYCECCGEYVHGNYYNYDADMCDDCARENGADLISGYHDRPALEFFGKAQARWRGAWRGIGCELEIDRADRDTDAERETAEKIKDLAGDELYFNRDGSLRNGFEIITQPHTIDAFDAMPWREILQAAKDGGYSSHDIGTCGLHLHFSRAFFGATEDKRARAIAKLIRFYDARWADILKVSRRTDDQASHWAARYCTLDRDEARELGNGKKRAGRYFAINLTNYSTVEFRLMRGTLNYNTFRACIDFCITLARNARKIRWTDIDDAARWLDGAQPATLEYIRNRGAFADVTGKEAL